MTRPRRLSFWIILPLLLLVVIIGIAVARVAASPERRLVALDAASGQVVWSVPVDMAWNAYTQPVVDGSRLYVSTHDSDNRSGNRHWQLTALETADGQAVWTYAPFGEAGTANLCLSMVTHSAVVADGQVYTWVCAGAQGDGSETFDRAAIVALDAATGRVLWEHPQPELTRIMVFGSPLPLRVIGSEAYVLSVDAADQWRIDVLDTKTGDRLRQIPLPALAGHGATDLPVPSLQTDAGSLFVNVEQIMALAPDTGAPRFQVNVNQAPWLADDGLFGQSRQAGPTALASYQADTGALRWQQPINQLGLPTAAAGQLSLSMQLSADAERVYVLLAEVPGLQTWITALRRTDGKPVWYRPVPTQADFSAITVRPASNGQQVVFPVSASEAEGAVEAVSAADGSPLWRFSADTQGQSPVIDDQRVYFLDYSPRYRYWLSALNPAWH